MKKSVKKIVVSVLAGAFLVGGMVLAKDYSEKVEIWYNNIKIYIDGAEYVAKDANGNVVEPFTYNGTTYLPVRGIANAFGKDVEWDGATQSVYLGKKDQTKPDNYLHKIQYNDYKEGRDDSDFSVINGNITDFNGNIYTNGILFYNNPWDAIEDDADEADILIAYPLNSQYKKLNGKIVLPKEYNISTWGKQNAGNAATDVLFYGDGHLLYKATNVTSSMPFVLDYRCGRCKSACNKTEISKL